jgi:hypothetical protein
VPRAQRAHCLAGHVRFELRNVVANYPFESSRGFPQSEPNSGHAEQSRLSCSGGDTQLGAGFCGFSWIGILNVIPGLLLG